MRHRVAGRKFDRSTNQRRALFRSLVTDLLRHEKLTTTEAKAKEIRGIAERIITLGKKGGLHHRRQALSFLLDKDVAAKLFSEIGPRYKERPGGYTRITKLGQRKGDAAFIAMIELVK